MTLEPGTRIVVHTPDRHRYQGRLLQIQTRANGQKVAVVRLDTGWETSFPLHMVEKDSRQ